MFWQLRCNDDVQWRRPLHAMRAVFWSVIIQATSSAAVVAAALLVASRMGLAAQGEFGLLRSWTDALVTVAVFGLPQGLLHLMYRDEVPVAILARWVRRYITILAILCAAAGGGGIFWAASGDRTAASLSMATMGVVVVAVPFMAAHLLWRSLLLRHIGAVPYAIITAAPAWLVFIGLLPVSYMGWRNGIAWPLLVAAMGAALISGLLVWHLIQNQPTTDHAALGWSRRTLWHVSVETGVQNVLIALSPALVLSGATWAGASLAQVGAVSLGLHIYQLFGVAAAYLAPMFYDRMARSEQMLTNRQLWERFLGYVTWPSVLIAAVGFVSAMLAVRLLWPDGANSWMLLALMALAGVLSMAVRLLITLMLARGVFRPLTLQALGRLVLSGGGTVALMQLSSATLAVPVTLVFTEFLVMCWLLRTAHTNRPMEETPA